jgi:hypothetical protein
MNGRKNDTSGGGRSGETGDGGWNVTYSASLNTVRVQTGQCSVFICVKPRSTSIPVRVTGRTSRCRPSRLFGWWSSRRHTAFRRWSESKIAQPACYGGLTIPPTGRCTDTMSAGTNAWAARWLRRLTAAVVRVASSTRSGFIAIAACIRGGIRSRGCPTTLDNDERPWFDYYT